VRKSQWRRLKRLNDPDYRENQKHAYKKWLKESPHYWKEYRASHPDYAKRNRKQQRERNLLRKKQLGNNASLIAKSDALIPESPLKTGIYQLVPVTRTIAKSDALIVKISFIPEGYNKINSNCKRPLYRQSFANPVQGGHEYDCSTNHNH
jgi:hypothetical protein